MIVVLLDTKTGKTVVIDEDISPWQWCENNWSCDCNRSLYFGEEVEDELSEEFGEGVCYGEKRFLIVGPMFFEDEDHCYSLGDMNKGYPEELIEKHILRKWAT